MTALRHLPLAAALVAALASAAAAAPTTTAFTYQGVLQKNGVPMTSASANLRFELYDAATLGAQVGGTITVNALAIANGLVTVTLDFGTAPWDGQGRWLEIAVQDQGEGSFTVLSPRQSVTPAPYALHALSADVTLALPFAGSAFAPFIASFQAENFSPNTLSYGVLGRSTSTAQNAAGVFGENTGVAGNTVGVSGSATGSATGTGVVGIGGANGGYFRGERPGSDGVEVATIDGSGVGLRANMTTGIGVYGAATSPGGFGGYFASSGGATPLYVDGMAKVKGIQILGGADLAEHFPVRGHAEPGMVLVLDEEAPGGLRVSDRAECPNVAGIVSGANGLAAGITLADGEPSDRTAAVALSGRVWVNADARREPIRIGDRLTTSDLAGYARRAGARAPRRGAVIGKAMSALEAGTGHVLVLVDLR